MKRRIFFRNIALGTTGTLSLSKATHAKTNQRESADTKAKIKWHMATSWPDEDNITFTSAKYFCKQVKDMTGGNFVIEPHVAGRKIKDLGNKVIPALEVFSNVHLGDVQCGHTASYYYLGEDPSLAFRTGIPFGLNPYQQYTWFYKGEGRRIMEEFHGRHKLLTFPAGSPGCQMGGWFKETVEDIGDLKGLKIRIPGLGAEVIERMDAIHLPLGGDQVTDVLTKGETEFLNKAGKKEIINKDDIDAIEWQNPFEDKQLELYKFAKNYYYPGFWEPGTTYEIIINQSEWEKLSRENKLILETAAATTNLTMLAEYDARNGKALRELTRDYGVNLKRFNTKILERAYKETFELLEEKANANDDFKKIYDEWKKFRSRIFQWNWYNELAFDEFFHCDG